MSDVAHLPAPSGHPPCSISSRELTTKCNKPFNFLRQPRTSTRWQWASGTKFFEVMALDEYLDSNCLPMILPGNGAEGILEALVSNRSLKNDEHFDSILSMARLNPNLGSDVPNSTILERSSTSRTDIGHDAAFADLTLPAGTYLQSHSNTTLEPYISVPVSFPIDGLVNVSYNGDIFSQLCQAREEESKKEKLEGAIGFTDLCRAKGQRNQNSLPVRMQREPGFLAPILKKPRLDVNQENTQQQQQQQDIIQESLLKELQDCNPQLKAMMNQHSQQIQLQQQILHSAPQLRGFHLQIPKQLPKHKTRVLLHDRGNQQETFAPLLDGGICSRRLKQYLYHMRNNTHENGISYWKKFVSEYYAPGSKKRWCFSKYENVELHTAGVFFPKTAETYCCQICGLKSGKGLEATSEIFPRLFKMKFESGMLDEILYIDSPRAHKVPYGLVLEYRKAVQASVYETFRVVHNGKLRVAFRHDLKILSWEFCIENHEEYLLQTLFTPQVKQLVHAVEKYQDIQDRVSSRASLLDLRKVCDMCVSAGIEIARNTELPLVNGLGYPKRFIRCLQICEVVDSMTDLMAFSRDTKMGPIDCLNNYPQRRKLRNQGTVLPADDHNSPENGAITGLETSGSAFQQLLGQGSSVIDHSDQAMAFAQSFNSYFHKEAAALRSQSSECTQVSHRALVDKMLVEMVAASRGKSAQESFKRPNGEAPQQSHQTCATSKKPWNGDSSDAATARVISTNVLTGAFSNADSHCGKSYAVKAEPCSPDLLPEAFLSSAAALPNLEGFGW